MPIVVSGDDRAPFHIVSCTIPDGKAISVARAVIKECKEWGIEKDELTTDNSSIEESPKIFPSS